MAKILVTGSAGFVGKNIFNFLKNKHSLYGISRRESPTTTHRYDLTSEGLTDLLDQINPDIIIHTAALTSVDYCEIHPEEVWKANVLATKNLVDWCKKNNRKMIYISTDYVYPGISNNYDEISIPQPINEYGKTKFEGEKLVYALIDWCILRPTVIFGYDVGGNNFLMQILSLKEKRRIPFDQLSNPTDVTILCEYIHRIIDLNVSGIYVSTGPETMSRYEFALLISEVFGLDKSFLEKIYTMEFNQIAKRPLNNGTDSSKIRAVLNYKTPTVKESLLAIKNQLSKAH